MTRTRNPVTDSYNEQERLRLQREQMDRAAVASGNVDENSALYRHAKLNGWDMGDDEPFHGQAGRKWYAAEQAAKGRMMDARADMMEADADLRAGYDGIVANATAQRLDRARRGRATLGSIVGHAMRNGGMVPRELAQSVGMELGDPGFVGGTLAKDGTFMSLGRDSKGGIRPTGVVSSIDVAKAMKDSGNWRDAQKYVKQFLKGRLTDQQIESATGYSELWAQQSAAKERQRRSVEIEKVVMDGIRDMLKDKPDMTPGEAWRSLAKNNPKALESYLTRQATDEEVNNGAADDKGNVPLSPEEGFKKFESLWNLGKSGGAAVEQSGNPRFDQIGALLDRLERMNAPAPADPNAVKMAQRANARANVIDAAGGRQQRILEVLPDGSLAETNGYVANGRVYDANGDERQGQFLDENRRPIVPTVQPAQGQGQVSQADAAAEFARRKAARAGQAQDGADYGLRHDGKTYKGTGWLGVLKLPNGGEATEYSVGVNIGGKEMDIPTLVPGLSQEQISRMVNDIIPNGKDVPRDILDIAVAHAKSQLAKGDSVWANDGQSPAQGGEAASSSVSDLAQPVAALDGRTLAQSSEPQEKPQAQSSGILSADDERFLDETLRELEAPEEPEVVFPEDNPDYERRRRNGKAAREREAQKRAAEELPDWAKNLSAEDQARYKAARTAARGIEALTKEMGKTQGAASTSTADSYAAMLDALGPNGSLRQKLSRLLSIIDKVGGSMSTSDF